MKKINYIKITLDLLMAITFVLLMNPRVLNGLPFHEIAGLAIGVAVLTHILLNFRWVKKVTLKIVDKNLPGKTRFSYFLNLMLLISMSAIIVTGILISRVVFPNLSGGENHGIRGLHNLASYLTLGLVGVHVGVHWQWVMSVLKKIFLLKGRKPQKGAIVATVIALGILIGGYQLSASKFSTSTARFNEEQRSFPGNDQGFNQTEDNGQAALPNSTNQGNNEDKNTAFQNREFGERHGRGGEFREGHGGQSPFSVILFYFIILAIIIVPTYFLEKRLLRKKRKLVDQ